MWGVQVEPEPIKQRTRRIAKEQPFKDYYQLKPLNGTK